MTIAEQWEEYSAKVLRPVPPPDLMEKCKRIFYAGALAYMRALAASPEGAAEDSAAALLDEVRAFVFDEDATPHSGAVL